MGDATRAEQSDMRRWVALRLGRRATEPPFSFDVGGKPMREAMTGWSYRGLSRRLDSDRTSHAGVWTDSASQLDLAVDAIEYRATAAVEWVVRIRNMGAGASPLLEDIRALDALFAAEPAAADRVDDADGTPALHYSLGDSNSGESFRPMEAALAPGEERTFAPHGGRSSDGVMPFFTLHQDGDGLGLAVGWSGQWSATFKHERAGGTRIRAGMEKTRIRLRPGEEIRTPRMLLAFYRGDDADRGSRLIRRTLINHVTPRRDGEVVFAPICGTIGETDPDGTYEGPHVRVMKPLAAVGVEVFWSDMDPQQWYPGGFPGGTGTWEHDPAKYPRGLKPVGDAAREAGLGYLLWFEPERVAAGTQIAREHPEWVIGGANGGLFRLDLPEARKWITDKVDSHITQAGIGWVRWDFNMPPLGHWRATDEPEREGMTEIRHIEGLYAMWDDLRSRHPGLLIDICASGGRRLDIETLRHGLPLWHSDLQCEGAHPEADQLQNAGLYRWLPLHACGLFGLEPSYAFRSAATTGNVFALAAHAPENADGVRRSIRWQKRLRPYALGDFHATLPHSADLDKWFAYQFHRPDLDAGCVFVYRRAKCADAEVTLGVAGVRRDRRYSVEADDGGVARIMTGAQMAEIKVTVPEAPGSAVIVYQPAPRAP